MYRAAIINALSSLKNSPWTSHPTIKPEIAHLIKEFSTVFRSELPAGLPPKREADHSIKLEENHKPPHSTIFELSPAELLATKEYVTDLSKEGKICPSRPPYGTPLFFVKSKGKLRGVIAYRGLNRITKPNNCPIP